MSLFHSGEREHLKAGVHAAIGVLSLLCAGYNVIAWTQRRERHLAVNTLAYACLTVWEGVKVRHHAR